MTRSIRAAALLVVLSAAAAPVAAQTNPFAPGAQVNSPAITGVRTDSLDTVGMQVAIDVAGGDTISTAWANFGGNVCGGSFANGFSVSLACNADSFTNSWSVVGATSDRITSVRINGAPSHTLLDGGWNGQICSANGQVGGENQTGTAGSSTGWSLETIAGGNFGGTVLGSYTNIVAVKGDPAVGDLSERRTITFVGALGANLTYNFRADTDNSLIDQPPPRIVPEPSACALMFSGLVGVGVMARRRRNV